MNKKIIVGILISVILVYLAFKGINFQDVLNVLKKIQAPYVLAFTVTCVTVQFLRSYRWGIILKPLSPVDPLTLFAVSSIGFLTIAALPARLGELARPYLISKRSPIKMSSALGSILIERILDSFTILSIAFVIILLTDLPLFVIHSSLVMFGCAAALFGFVLFVILRRESALQFIQWILNKLPLRLRQKLNEWIHPFIEGLEVMTNAGLFLYLACLSLVIWLLNVLSIHFLLKSFGFTLPVLAPFVLMVILLVGIAIPAGPGFIGNWHYACWLGLSLFGLPKTDAVSFAVLYHFLSMLILLVLGLAFLPFNRFAISEIKKQMYRSL